MSAQTTIFALFAVLVALMWSAWDFVCDEWRALQTSHKWVVGMSAALLFCLCFIRGVVPVVWQYGNLLLSLF